MTGDSQRHCNNLRNEGYEVLLKPYDGLAGSIRCNSAEGASNHPDVMMPRLDGLSTTMKIVPRKTSLSFCRQVRGYGQSPGGLREPTIMSPAVQHHGSSRARLITTATLHDPG